MKWLRRYPVFVAWLLVVGAVVLGEVGLVAERRIAARGAQRRLDQVTRGRRAQETIQPAPTPENTARIAAELARVTRKFAILQAELHPAGGRAARFYAAPAPSRRPEAYFDIAAFVETMRTRARQAGVGLRPDERFGFSDYAHEAPETGQLAVVFRERLAVQYLLEALLEAQPHQLLAVQRSRPGRRPGVSATASSGQSAGREGPGATAADYFEMDPRISARVPGLVEATAFRLTFTGHTDTLRTLLAKLAEFELPLVVRAVEVTPVERPRDGTATGPAAIKPLVASAWSRFTVTIELIAFSAQPKAAA